MHESSNEFRTHTYHVRGLRGVRGHRVGLKMSKVNVLESLFVANQEWGVWKMTSLKPAWWPARSLQGKLLRDSYTQPRTWPRLGYF